MFLPLLYALRAEGVPVATQTWLLVLDAVREGLIHDLDSLYVIGRSLVARSEADFDAWDLAFAKVFKDLSIDPALREKLEAWLTAAAQAEGERAAIPFADEQLWDELRKRLQEQTERHDGGSHWVGAGGTSPFGNSGRAASGIRVGGQGGGRSAVAVADARAWEAYRADAALEVRDQQVALKALRKLQREGRYELDIDGTIDRTAHNGGEIELVERRDRENAVRVVLLMDSGGSMAPHAQRVQQLFTAADALKTFRSFESYVFHNCPYSTLWDAEQERVPTGEVLAKLTPRHRLIFVGDASMAPYELFSAVGWGWSDQERVTGIEWLRRFKAAAPSSVWLNPDPPAWWDHPTVEAIGGIFPMFELTVDGLRKAVGKLRAPV